MLYVFATIIGAFLAIATVVHIWLGLVMYLYIGGLIASFVIRQPFNYRIWFLWLPTVIYPPLLKYTWRNRN